MRLFGSSSEHHDSVDIEIGRGEFEYLYGTQALREGEHLLTVRMTVQQLGEAIMGAKWLTPCTIATIGDDKVDQENPKDIKKEFVDNFQKEIARTISKIDDLKRVFNERLSKKSIGKGDREFLKNELDRTCATFVEDLPFYAAVFNEQITQSLEGCSNG